MVNPSRSWDRIWKWKTRKRRGRRTRRRRGRRKRRRRDERKGSTRGAQALTRRTKNTSTFIFFIFLLMTYSSIVMLFLYLAELEARDGRQITWWMIMWFAFSLRSSKEEASGTKSRSHHIPGYGLLVRVSQNRKIYKKKLKISSRTL